MVIVVSGGTFWWINQKQQILNDEIASLKNQVSQLQQASPTQIDSFNNQSDELTDELIKVKFELALSKRGQIWQVFQDPLTKNKFYYTTNSSDGSSIWVYDVKKDKAYQPSGNLNLPAGSTLLLNQQLAEYQEFRGVGIIDNKFVFIETSSSDSPGPCFSPWFYSNLSYIDLNISNPTRKPFTVPQDLRISEEQKAADCLKDF